MLPT